jgi:hypothetical protein
MRTRRVRGQRQLQRKIHTERRRLGRFVALAEIEANLSPVRLCDQPSREELPAVPTGPERDLA